MLTTEKKLQINGDFDWLSLKIEPFCDKEVSNELTDTDVSMRLVDANGNVVLLIEAIGVDINENDDANNTRGCFIKRFEFVEDIINTEYYTEFLNSFLSRVCYSMIPCDNGRFLGRYYYIWVQKSEEQQCVIAEALGLIEVLNADNIVVYKRFCSDILKN